MSKRVLWTTFVSIDAPEDWFLEMPIYEGPVAGAHHALEPGEYRGYADGRAMIVTVESDSTYAEWV